VALGQIAIAGGLSPPFISSRFKASGVRRLCKSLAFAITLLGLCLLNTPARVAFYTEAIPNLAFLRNNESVMFEYGFRYHLPGIYDFNSRLPKDKLGQVDKLKAEENAAILNQFRADSTYRVFLEKYPAVSAPFLHEMRVHLFRRDRYLQRALIESKREAEYCKIAFGENLVLEDFFTETLAKSHYVLSKKDRDYLEKNREKGEYGSAVSYYLISSFSENVVIFCLSFLLSLTLVCCKIASKK